LTGNRTDIKYSPMRKMGDKPAKTIYDKIKNDLGISRAFLKKNILPDWWDDEILESGSGRQEFQLYLLGHLGIPIECWIGNRKLRFGSDSAALFKKSVKQDIDKFTIAIQMAKSIARKSIHSISKKQTIPKSAQAVREKIRMNPLKLSTVLDYFHSLEIPIIPIYGLPKNVSLPAGMVFKIEGKYAIAIGSRKKSPTQQAFHLLHELGHIALGHVKEDSATYVDIKIEKDQDDELETEANRFAVEILTGIPNFETHLYKSWDPEAFADLCKKEAKKIDVDPAFIALNVAWANPKDKLWPFINRSLEYLEEKDALEQITQSFFRLFPKEEISDDNFEFLERIAQG
jgi:hypothetical protein